MVAVCCLICFQVLGEPKGYGYVDYEVAEDAAKAILHMNGAQVSSFVSLNMLSVLFPSLFSALRCSLSSLCCTFSWRIGISRSCCR